MKAAGVPVGESILFFGCRSPEADFLYADELRGYARDGVTELLKARLDERITRARAEAAAPAGAKPAPMAVWRFHDLRRTARVGAGVKWGPVIEAALFSSGRPVLLELELAEPSLFLGYADGAPDREALEAVVAARDGLARLSRERVRAELMKLLVARGAAPTLRAPVAPSAYSTKQEVPAT